MKTTTPFECSSEAQKLSDSLEDICFSRAYMIDEAVAPLVDLLSRYVTEPTHNQKLKAEAVEALERWRVKDSAQT